MLFVRIVWQEEEVSEELLTFHKAVFQMQAQEEELIDCHHQLTEVSLSIDASVFVLFLLYLGTRSFHVLIAVQLADAFSAVTLLVGHQEEHSACKNWVMGCWCGYLSGARCRLFAYGPADATAIPNAVIFCLIYIQTGLPFWYRLTQVVLEKRPLNRCSSQLVNAAS